MCVSCVFASACIHPCISSTTHPRTHTHIHHTPTHLSAYTPHTHTQANVDGLVAALQVAADALAARMYGKQGVKDPALLRIDRYVIV